MAGPQPTAENLPDSADPLEFIDVLFVEGSVDDEASMRAALRRGGYAVRSQRVATADDLRRALEATEWDVVISDFDLPGFGPAKPLEIVRAHDPELPLIIVARAVPDDVAANAMRAGARDFVPKDHLTRLAPVVERELREVASRKQTRLAQERVQIVAEALEIHEQVLSEMPLGVVVHGASADPVRSFPVLWVNPAATQILRRSDDMLGQPLAEAIPEFEDPEILSLFRAVAAGGAGGVLPSFKLDRAGCDERVLEIRIARVAAGLVAAFINDITERSTLEAQMRAAQRMETVGRLAGGVAHDFNNLMTVVESYSGFLLDRVGPTSPLREDLTVISDAALRASRLTNQLLASSRRQPQQLEHFSVNNTIRDLDRMLQRVAGERVEFVTHLAEALAAIRADRTQLEQVIMNLVVNACDAMPTGGRLTIETDNVELDPHYCRSHRAFVPPGDYVMIAVSDTGSGIDDATLEHIFEPFFTTKPRGQGTGLGLSTVYGIVKQSGGYIWPYSEVGRGTCFKIYMPASTEEAAADGAREVAPPRGGTETILVAEDEEMVRRAAVRTLARAGYTTLEARDGGEAVRLAREYDGSIDLMLTDVMMPVLDGREAYELVSQPRPALRVIYMSGYTDNTIDVHGTLETGTRLLQKPFSGHRLLCKVREALDGEKTPVARLQERRILIIDDDAPVLRAMHRLLDDDGYSVVAYESIEDAQTYLRRDSDFFAVLCDLHVGSRSGLELRAWLDAEARDLANRFILVTGGSTSAEAAEFIKRHPTRVIRKPINLAELESRLATLKTMERVA